MPLDRILPEIKGADIRSNATRGTPRQRRHAIGFQDRILGLLQHHDAKLVARIWVKGIGLPFDATSVYTSSIQGICSYFEHYLTQTNGTGICIADSRNKFKNVSVSHSIFTRSSVPRRRVTNVSLSCRPSGTAITAPVFRFAILSVHPCSTPSLASPIAPVM